MHKPTIYLPVEIKAREFYSHLLLAEECCKLGFRVYIGDKESIFWMLKNKTKKRAGLFFYKSNLGKYEEKVQLSCEAVAILDQEIGLAANNLIESYKLRFPKNLNFDKYFLIGYKHKELLKEIFPAAIGKLCVTGWPKFDLYHKRFSRSFIREVSNDDKYIFMASDFGYNSKKNVNEAFARINQSDISEQDKQVKKRHVLESYNLCRAFVVELKNLKISSSNTKVIFRPHPGEDHDQWLEDFKKIKAVDCIYEGDVASWIASAHLFVHRGSTTAIQSFMMGVPTVALDAYYDDNRKNLLSYRVSSRIKDLTSVLLDCEKIIKEFGKREINFEEISSEILIEDELASTKIAKELAAMHLELEGPYKTNTLSRFYYYCRQRLGNLFRKYIYDKSAHKYYKKEDKIQSGFSAGEGIKFYIKYHLDGLEVRDVAHNLIEIDFRG